MPTAPEPTLHRLGNVRFAGLSSPGWPADPLQLAAEVAAAIAANPGTPPPEIVGPVTIWFASAPGSIPASHWECQVGRMISGMLHPGATTAGGARILVEDYRQLQAYRVAHRGPVRDLVLSHARLSDAASAAGRRLRPYWRVLLRATRLADGAILPQADVEIFIDG